jgi:hypothetical protein
MLKPFLQFLLASSLTVTGGASAKAEGFIDSIEFSSMLESELAIGTVTGDVQKAEFVLTPEIGLDLTPSMRLTVIARLRGDLADELEPGRPAQRNRSAFSKRLFVGNHVDVELREAYIDTEIGNTFLRVGKQQVVWGQADGLKVLDVLNPQSFREFILDDFEDSRIPLWMVNAEIPIGDAMFQLLWIPDNTYDDIPEPGATFAFTSPLIVPELPPGVPVTILPPDRPNDFYRDSDVGAKFSVFVGGWDLSLNYAYHYFDRPVVRREISTAGITVRQDYERTHLLGGTFSNVFGDFTLRGEVGYSSDRFFLTNDATDADGVIGSGELSYVLGLDYQGWRDWFISAQIFQSIITDPAPGLVRDDVDTTATLLIRRDFMNDSLQAEALLIQSLNQSDGALQASLNYEWRTNIRLKVGADIFYGNSQGLFGQFKEKDRISMGIEFGF